MIQLLNKITKELGAKAEERRCYFGHEWVFSFPNGFSAAISNMGKGSERGLFETAVVWNDRIVFDTPIANDVIGEQTEEEAFATARAISELPSNFYD